MQNTDHREKLQTTIDEISSIILGKEHKIKLALSCLFANGHLLIEDFPGVGKTTLAESIALTFGIDYKRVQCTNDMMPSDIIGTSILDKESHQLRFKKGAIFTNLLLSDEINRSTPKTQSALLEAMEERQVSIEGKTLKLDSPFFVIATQNPLEQAGTFPLPESQLDRFLMRISLGYPDNESEKKLLQGQGSRSKINKLKQTLSSEELLAIQKQVKTVKVNDKIVDYILQILDTSRTNGQFQTGLSPRAGIAIKEACQAWAFMESRNHVIPQDLIQIIAAVACHRLISKDFSIVDEAYLQEHLLKQLNID